MQTGGVRRISVGSFALAVRGRDAIEVIAAVGGRWKLPVSELHDFQVMASELWVVSGAPLALTRYALEDGAPIGVPLLLPGSRAARLLPGTVDGVAIWSGEQAFEIDGRSGKPGL